MAAAWLCWPLAVLDGWVVVEPLGTTCKVRFACLLTPASHPAHLPAHLSPSICAGSPLAAPTSSCCASSAPPSLGGSRSTRSSSWCRWCGPTTSDRWVADSRGAPQQQLQHVAGWSARPPASAQLHGSSASALKQLPLVLVPAEPADAGLVCGHQPALCQDQVQAAAEG